MKINYIYFLFLFAAIAALFPSCDLPYDQEEFGRTNIYMPQATLFSSGTNIYPIPEQGSNYQTYTVDSINDKLEIILGASRSGLTKQEGYSVKVSVDNDTITNLINAGALQNTVLLSSGNYSLPESLTVPAGSVGDTFKLRVNLNTLRANYGKKVALAVKISDPTNYTLNKSLSTTIVLIDTKMILGFAGQFDPTAYYYIKLHIWDSPNVLGIKDNSDADGELIQQQTRNDTNPNQYQHWKVIHMGNDRFVLENRGSGKVLGTTLNRVPGYNWPDPNLAWYGAAQRTRSDADLTQRWRFHQIPNTEQFALINAGLNGTNQVLDVWGYDTTVGGTNFALHGNYIIPGGIPGGNRGLDGNNVFYFQRVP